MFRRGTGKLVFTIIAVVVGGTWLNNRTGNKVIGFKS